MIQVPGHLADRGSPIGEPEPVAGLDWAVAKRSVQRAGGRPDRFTGAMAAAQRAAGGPDDTALLAGIAGIAAWRAGALAYRQDALARIDALASDAARRAAAAALDLDMSGLAEFAKRQRTDRFWWPGRAALDGYVCAVGGFAGLGGAWVAPADAWYPLGEPGAFAIRTGDRWWRLDADVWGSRLLPLDAQPQERGPDQAASIVCLPDTYLAWVHVEDAA
ncbi:MULTISPECIES: potassium transporter Kef [unclassified Microbacterium]|uniref:potassium transporter Kef n=1 Tax=unclassified Microbacterium TaxID=2609290 RepID=UPI00214D102E|nr:MULTISPECIES: potassium transporter Kef [unclassified Microbacterium]MCR2783741.1 potassium transporter Kef [Microbacterium sp. zg.B96]WIM15406.1 potassium transporter Kef [Microbacterium sp. zg-B96]